jgi:hypothetical protein
VTRVLFTRKSGNEKTGPIPISITERASCPESCALKNNGCYADGWPMKLHWDRAATHGLEWPAFCAQIAALPDGQLWRANTAGDLPHNNQTIDRVALEQLVTANEGRQGFTYTHHTTASRENRAAIADAALRGFTINVSHDSLEQLDRGVADVLPSVVVLPKLEPNEREPKVVRSPAGRKVVVCPAQWRDTNCADCGLCAKADRKYVIGFRAHGNASRKASNVASNIVPTSKLTRKRAPRVELEIKTTPKQAERIKRAIRAGKFGNETVIGDET